jgi:hypothetical protein
MSVGGTFTGAGGASGGVGRGGVSGCGIGGTFSSCRHIMMIFQPQTLRLSVVIARGIKLPFLDFFGRTLDERCIGKPIDQLARGFIGSVRSRIR